MTTPTQTESAVLRDAIAVLREARKLLERGWCQEMMACDAEGAPAPNRSSAACRRCLMGALCCACSFASREYSKAFFLLQVATGNPLLADWNDAPGRTQAEVLAAVDRAVELGEQELAKLEGGER